ncbi:uncharacterized protein [Macrobrachium rosenbergii]|uniref:uncharacterized protein isoform X2 n=1 Tax=Macrobrachium rosenbergii TaxID=79674 RepID=UPI0034D75074
MKPTIFALILFLTVGNFAHCQEWENLLFIKMEEVLQKQEAVLNQVKGMQEKQENMGDKLEEMQGKLGLIENNLREMQEKLELVENNLQGIPQETRGCLGRDDFEAGQQKLESSLHQEISGVISLLETGGIDECSEGTHSCGTDRICTEKFFSYTCSCPPGFAWNGPHCEDIDECAQGEAECSPHAECRNSVGSYSCSCNPPFEGDGNTCSCPLGFAQNGSHCDEFLCKSPGKAIQGLGCVKSVNEWKTWEQMRDHCWKEGWRLLQGFDSRHLRDIEQAYPFAHMGPWVSIYDGKWAESGAPIGQELWVEGYQADSPRRCGFLERDSSSSSSVRVTQGDCSYPRWGLCQFVF